MSGFKLKKMYGWKEDLRYYLLLPKWMFRAFTGVVYGDHKLNEMTISDYFSLACACCDAEAGRFYMEDKE